MAQGKSRHFIKTFLNVPRWVGVSELVNVGKSIKSLGKSLFVVKQPERIETFEQAIERLHLTEADIKNRCKWSRITAFIYFLAALVFLGYGVHILLLGHYMSFVTTMVLTVLLLTFSFREHFWYTQMKHRRLGFTVKEWFKSSLNF